MLKSKIFLSFFIFFSNSLFGIINLEKLVQDFVIETKQIEIPNYALTFNPSIVEWHGNFLMSFRIREKNTTNQIGLIWLDQNFEPIGEAYILKIEQNKPVPFYMQQPGGPQEQDPRLITIGKKLFIVYSHYQVGKMCIAQIIFENQTFIAKNSVYLLNFDGFSPSIREKNWVPFEYQDQLLLAQNLSPHKILRPSLLDGTCQTVAITQHENPWQWGELSGGTPALKINDKYYLGFFHSSLGLVTDQSENKKIHHYFMGAYLFSASDPFKITHLSPEPIVAKSFYEKPHYHLYKPLRVVFPGGFLHDTHFIWVFYGRHDNEVWFVKLDKKKLLASLVKV